MQTGSLFLAVFIAVAAAQVPPTPCPSTPAQYCNCAEGDHGFKWLCRANNGYTWETNDAKPINPCPSKYPTCNLNAAVEEIVEKPSTGCALVDGDIVVFQDMHDGDQKQVTLEDGRLSILPYANNETWATYSDFDDTSCSASVDFNVPNKPSPPPINLTATFWRLSNGDDAKVSAIFNDFTGKIAPAAQPLNAWVQVN